MRYEKPKDYMLAETAYNTYWETPQVPFDALSHAYQMKWVHAIRMVIEAHERFRRSPESVEKQKATMLSNKVDKMVANIRPVHHRPGKKFKGTEEQRLAWRLAKRASDEKKRAKSNGASTT